MIGLGRHKMTIYFHFYCFCLFLKWKNKKFIWDIASKSKRDIIIGNPLINKGDIHDVLWLELARAQMVLYWVNSRLVKVTTSGRYAGSIALISRAAPLEDTALCHTVNSQDSRFRYHLRSFYSHVGFGLASFRPGRALSAASCSPTRGQCQRGGKVLGTSPAGLPGWPRAGPRGRSWRCVTCPRATPL